MNTQNQQPENESVGALLKRTRLAKKLDLQDVASYLCIRARFLESLEDGDTKDLPGDAYAQGFVRSYAAHLGLDPAEIVSRYKQETSGAESETRAVSSVEEGEAEHAAPAPIVLIVSLVLLLIAYGLWKGLAVDSPEEVVVLQEPVTVVEGSYPLPENVIVEDVEPVQTVDGAVQGSNVVLPVETVPAAVVEVAPAVAPVEAVKTPAPAVTPTVAPAVVPPVPQKKPEPVVVPEKSEEVPMVRIYGQKNYDPRIVLVANEDTWVEVKRDENVLLSRVLKKNDRYQVSRNSEKLVLKTGNAGGLDVYLDGNKVAPIGPHGALRTNVPLDPAFFGQETTVNEGFDE